MCYNSNKAIVLLRLVVLKDCVFFLFYAPAMKWQNANKCLTFLCVRCCVCVCVLPEAV